ncbi:MAG: glycoside hydrolase family 31 protein, partial [Ketobacteraceae bacterium]|nr:glycoside hydrolase family 31 protein [Ketobacteraceae bacterium]
MTIKKAFSLFAMSALALACGCSGSSGSGTGQDSDNVGDSNTPQRTLEVSLGDFRLDFNEGSLKIYTGNQLTWQSVPDSAFVQAGIHELHAEEVRGSFTVEENLQHLCDQARDVTATMQGNALIIQGELSGDSACATGFEIMFSERQPGHLGFEVSFSNPSVNYSRLVYGSSEQERFHGFGEQFSILNMKGQRLPILSEEGGVGRGHPVISFPVNLASPGSAGNALTTYYASPQYITNTNRAFLLENTDYAIFDLTRPEAVSVSLFNGNMKGRILAGNSMLDMIERVTEYTGRMRPLPDWFNEGAIVGMQGGTEKVTAVLNELKRRGTPIGGFWLQDWVGKRQTTFGSQLWWNWELDTDRYPDWDGLVDAIEAEGGHMLCYINPFLVDATPKGNVRRNLYQEALDNGYMAKKPDGSVYKVTNTDFDAGMVDLTNPSAVNWMKQVIKDQLISEGRCRGWMHDFAEALPFDAVLFSGEPAATYHNQYPVDWAKLAREAIEEAGLEDDIVFFNRSGAARTPAYSTLLWQGDQLVTWDEHDGFKTSIMALLTGGFSGISL